MGPETVSGRYRWAATAACLLAAVTLSGCATLPGPETAPAPAVAEAPGRAEALSIIETLQKRNERLKSFKGVGRLTVRKDGKVQMDERIAWVGADPLKLSVVLFVSGFPAVRMASDGEWLYYQDGQGPDAAVRKIRSSDPDLKRILSIPIQASDIIALLCGRTPIREYRTAKVLPLPSGGGHVLLLSKFWGVHQKIFLDETRSEVRQTEVYDASGSLVYQANFLEMQLVDGYRVPTRLVVTGDGNAVVHLVVERYWADVPVAPSMFVLTPPG
jgi:hypothetical protein